MKLAIVDDNKLEQELIFNTLRTYEHERNISLDISSYSDGNSFLNTFVPGDFDLIFMDIYLNELNGIDIVRKIRQMDSKVMIVFLTTSKEYIFEAAPFHFFDYILKPIDAESTLSCIRHAIAKLEAARRRESNYEVLRSYFNENESYIQKQFLQELLFWSSPMSEDQLLVQKNLLHIDIRDFRLVVIKCHFYIDSISNQIEENTIIPIWQN